MKNLKKQNGRINLKACFALVLALVLTMGALGAMAEEAAQSAVYEKHPDAYNLYVISERRGYTVFYSTGDAFGEMFIGSDGLIMEDKLDYASYRDGLLGESAACEMLLENRPGAVITEIDLDEEDTRWPLYEGEATLDGRVYEFEMDAATGELLEWKRD